MFQGTSNENTRTKEESKEICEGTETKVGVSATVGYSAFGASASVTASVEHTMSSETCNTATSSSSDTVGTSSGRSTDNTKGKTNSNS